METDEENVRRALSTTKLQAAAVFEVPELQTGNHSVEEYTEEFHFVAAKNVGGLK